MSVIENLDTIEKEALASIAQKQTLELLDQERVALIGKKGTLTQILHSMGFLSAEERPLVGKRANEVRQAIEAALAEKKEELAAQELQGRIEASALDITLPGRSWKTGHRHIISQIVREIEGIFIGLGYTIETGPYIETEYYNFTSLNAPQDHPSRSPRDTFYVEDLAANQQTDDAHEERVVNQQADDAREAVAGSSLVSDVLLRTQTSPVQMRVMEAQKPPIYMLSPGRVFRPDTPDANHLPQFTQIEGLVVDKGITFADLKGTLDHMTRAIFGQDRKTRYRPHFFPFTEPSCEVDVSCGVCGGKGCRFCNHTGWLEILGAGMVDPNVLAYANIDADIYSGFAFGIGAERVAALRYNLPDLRLLTTGDMRFLEQF